MAHKPVLGKGLASLLPTAAPMAAYPPPAPAAMKAMGAGATSAGPAVPVAPTLAPESANKSERQMGISMIAPEDIEINPFQPRRDFDPIAIEELAQSIRENGLIQPLIVRKLATGKVELIAGERRLRASKLVGLKLVPIVIRRSTDRESLELALIENIQRQDLNCVDEALAYFQLQQEFQLTQEEIAKRVGKERATVANFLRLLKLPEVVIEDLKKGALTLGHGKAILALEEHEKRVAAREEVIRKSLSVRDTEALVERLKGGAAAAAEPSPTNANAGSMSPVKARLHALSQDLTRSWSTRVEIKGSAKRGKIVLHYASRQELERILMTMQNQKT